MPHGVDMLWSQSLSLRCVGVVVTCCAVWGVAVAVVALHGVSQLWLLHCVGCHGCSCCTVWGVAVSIFVPHAVLGHHLCAVCSVMVMVVAPQGVLWLLHRGGCCGHCTACSVMVVASRGVLWPLHHVQCRGCGVIVAAIVLRVMLQLWEGEDGHVSVGKGGGRWEVGECCIVRWKRKTKLHTISE